MRQSRRDQTGVVSRRGPMFVEETVQEERKGSCIGTILAGMTTIGITIVTSPIGEKMAAAAYKCVENPGALSMCNYEEMDMLYSVAAPIAVGLVAGAFVYNLFKN